MLIDSWMNLTNSRMTVGQFQETPLFTSHSYQPFFVSAAWLTELRWETLQVSAMDSYSDFVGSPRLHPSSCYVCLLQYDDGNEVSFHDKIWIIKI